MSLWCLQDKNWRPASVDSHVMHLKAQSNLVRCQAVHTDCCVQTFHVLIKSETSVTTPSGLQLLDSHRWTCKHKLILGQREILYNSSEGMWPVHRKWCSEWWAEIKKAKYFKCVLNQDLAVQWLTAYTSTVGKYDVAGGSSPLSVSLADAVTLAGC